MAVPAELFRIDALTGCHNFLSFVEYLDRLAVLEDKPPVSVLAADFNYLSVLNETRGMLYGDSALRWMALVLREESERPAYRIGGDEFAVIFTGEQIAAYEGTLQRIFMRLEKEAFPLGIPSPAASLILIHYGRASQWTPDNVLIHMDRAMVRVKNVGDRKSGIFSEQDFAMETASDEKVLVNSLRWISQRLLHRFIHMGRLLDEAQQAAYVDSASGLPNMRAALVKLEQTHESALSSGKPYSILLMDGDNLRLYNDISYVEGDEMIRRMGVLLSEKLRPGDFVARWRSGDEFIAVLPDTDSAGAALVGDRFRLAIRDASRSWQFPTSISIGIVSYPAHGDQLPILIDLAEGAMKRAKDEGKDRVVVSDG